jgi:hypothetical protein
VRTIRNTEIHCVGRMQSSVRTSQGTHYASATKPNRLMLFREIIAVYCENHTEHRNTLCGQSKKERKNLYIRFGRFPGSALSSCPARRYVREASTRLVPREQITSLSIQETTPRRTAPEGRGPRQECRARDYPDLS